MYIFSDPIHILAFEITNVYTIDRLCGHPLCHQKFHTYMSIRELNRATRNLFTLINSCQKMLDFCTTAMMQSSKLGMSKGYHLVIEGLRNGELFCQSVKTVYWRREIEGPLAEVAGGGGGGTCPTPPPPPPCYTHERWTPKCKSKHDRLIVAAGNSSRSYWRKLGSRTSFTIRRTVVTVHSLCRS